MRQDIGVLKELMDGMALVEQLAVDGWDSSRITTSLQQRAERCVCVGGGRGGWMGQQPQHDLPTVVGRVVRGVGGRGGSMGQQPQHDLPTS